jgi:hypothetical protein
MMTVFCASGAPFIMRVRRCLRNSNKEVDRLTRISSVIYSGNRKIPKYYNVVGMPYKVVEVKGGYKVKKDQPGRAVYFSKEPLSKDRAQAQLRALYASERRKG